MTDVNTEGYDKDCDASQGRADNHHERKEIVQDDSLLAEVFTAVELPPVLCLRTEDETSNETNEKLKSREERVFNDAEKNSARECRCDNETLCDNYENNDSNESKDDIVMLESSIRAEKSGIPDEHILENERNEELNRLLNQEILRQQREQLRALLYFEQQKRPLPDLRPLRHSHDEEEAADSGNIPVSGAAKQQLDNGKIASRHGSVNCVIVGRAETSGYSKNAKIRKVVVGGEPASNTVRKVVLLFGTKGVGKTSLLSSMLNYLYGVKKDHNFRFALSEDVILTEGLVEYEINNTILPYSVTFIDTPGVLDVEGFIETSSIIREWFEERLLSEGRFRLDAITIVLKSNEDELGWPYIHELAAVKRLFGDDLKTNVLPIITFTEVLPQPLAVRAMAYANITFLEYYKVNNSGFLARNSASNSLQYNAYFDDGLLSFRRYFKDLNDLARPLLSLRSTPYPTELVQNQPTEE